MTESLPGATAICLFTPRPGLAPQVHELVLPLVESSRSEPGCLGYDLYQEPDGPLVLVEQWASQEDFETHCAQPRVVDVFERRILELLDCAPEVHVTSPLTQR